MPLRFFLGVLLLLGSPAFAPPIPCDTLARLLSIHGMPPESRNSKITSALRDLIRKSPPPDSSLLDKMVEIAKTRPLTMDEIESIGALRLHEAWLELWHLRGPEPIPSAGEEDPGRRNFWRIVQDAWLDDTLTPKQPDFFRSVQKKEHRLTVEKKDGQRFIVLPNGKRYPVAKELWWPPGTLLIDVPYGGVLKTQTPEGFNPKVWSYLVQNQAKIMRTAESSGFKAELLIDGHAIIADQHHRMTLVAKMKAWEAGTKGEMEDLDQSVIRIRVPRFPDGNYYAYPLTFIPRDVTNTRGWLGTSIP